MLGRQAPSAQHLHAGQGPADPGCPDWALLVCSRPDGGSHRCSRTTKGATPTRRVGVARCRVVGRPVTDANKALGGRNVSQSKRETQIFSDKQGADQARRCMIWESGSKGNCPEARYKDTVHWDQTGHNWVGADAFLKQKLQ